MSYHITYFDPNDNWPEGGWSLYAINGDQIADRIVREKVNPKGYYEGKVIARHSWCGYIGTYGSLDRLTLAIREHRSELAKHRQ